MGWHYVDRGDPADYDLKYGYSTPTNWTPIQDAHYHELDISPYVPVGAKKVRLNVVVRGTTSLRTFGLRKRGQQNMYNVEAITTQIANVHIRGQKEIVLDDSRIIEYYCTAVPSGNKLDMICIAVEGWWMED